MKFFVKKKKERKKEKLMAKSYRITMTRLTFIQLHKIALKKQYKKTSASHDIHTVTVIKLVTDKVAGPITQIIDTSIKQ